MFHGLKFGCGGNGSHVGANKVPKHSGMSLCGQTISKEKVKYPRQREYDKDIRTIKVPQKREGCFAYIHTAAMKANKNSKHERFTLK